jgi:hypothetical protein
MHDCAHLRDTVHIIARNGAQMRENDSGFFLLLHASRGHNLLSRSGDTVNAFERMFSKRDAVRELFIRRFDTDGPVAGSLAVTVQLRRNAEAP